MKRYDFKENQRVEFNWSGVNGTGKIVGCSSLDIPILGAFYIVELDEGIKDYPYKCISIPRCAIREIE